jgi:hypothetical protein
MRPGQPAGVRPLTALVLVLLVEDLLETGALPPGNASPHHGGNSRARD